MIDIELLAPAGGMESLCAAVQSGANAVYIGGSKFSARAYASNFTDEDIKKAVDYCHLYKVKLYVTLNILIKDNEIKDALEYIKFLYITGVDALIVQDLGVASLIKKYFPDFELHASTQMTIHNGEGALFLKNIGFHRIVLSRELSLKEIKYISKDLNIETETFVHGALCVCYSGQCLMSSILGGRSGNRGRCAQPCRLPYTMINKETKEERKGFLLSPKDICTLDNVEDLIKTGTKSFKIEGRMKRPEYVAGVVRAYRKAIDKVLKKEDSFNFNRYNNELLQLFNREGFSKAYLYKNVGKDMISSKFPKNTGVFLGKVEKDRYIKLNEDLTLKDGIRNKDKGFTVSKIIKNNKEVDKAFKGDKIKIKPLNYKSGDRLYKASSKELLDSLKDTYKDKFGRKIFLDVKVKFKIGDPIEVYCIYDNKEYLVKGDIVQEAKKVPLTKEKINKSLKKSGETPFKIEKIDFQCFEEGFMPVSSLNKLRRDLVDEIENHILKNKNDKKLNIKNHMLSDYSINKNEMPETMILVNSKDQLKATIENGFQNIILDIFMKNDLKVEDIEKYSKGKTNVYLKIPNIIKEEFSYVEKVINNNIDYIKGIVTANLGIISKFNNKLDVIGDYKLNIFNSDSNSFYNKYLNLSCLSVELNKKELSNILRKNDKNQMLIYGKIENMVSEYCPIGSFFGGKSKKHNCNKPCLDANFYMKDRLGIEFPIKTDDFCRSHIYNSLPINLISNFEELDNMGCRYYRLDFIEETYSEVEDILKSFKKKKWDKDFKNYTRGHFKRGVQ
ncbi:U32 family peptidase [Clostridium oceanicum]|uniref:U32 family peptidase n=1 Tax=Clostridium oceanicum TaxID=1543 RepID=A0ABN1JWF9_9CLOT